jgi:hypothetical protein
MSKKMKRLAFVVVTVLLLTLAALPKEAANDRIPAGAKVFIAPMPDGFDFSLKEALEEKKVQLKIVDKREDADYEIAGQSDSQKAGRSRRS